MPVVAKAAAEITRIEYFPNNGGWCFHVIAKVRRPRGKVEEVVMLRSYRYPLLHDCLSDCKLTKGVADIPIIRIGVSNP